MTRSHYALEEGAPRRLTIAVTALGDAEVEFDGQVIAAFSRGELRKGSVLVRGLQGARALRDAGSAEDQASIEQAA